MSSKDTQSNMKQQIEDVIKRNLPEKLKVQYDIVPPHEYYEGFNQALSQINTSLIADEVSSFIQSETSLAHSLGKKEAIEEAMKMIETEYKRWNSGGEYYGNVSEALNTLKDKLTKII